jgi:hypothetical protein
MTKFKSEYKLLWLGIIISLATIYLTKIDSTPAKAKWIYDMGQYLWFNLAISYLSSVLFYWIVVYMPGKRKQRKFFFHMGMDIQMLHLKGWRFFYYLRNAAGMSNEIPDTGKITGADINKFLAKVSPQTVHEFENEPSKPKQTFQEYLSAHRIEMNDAINKILVIPYEDLDLYNSLLFLRRTSILTGRYIDGNDTTFGYLDVIAYFRQLQGLDNHFHKNYYPSIFGAKNAKYKKKG